MIRARARLVKDLLVGLVHRGHTVFLSTHVLEIAEQLCTRVGIIDHGQVIAIGTLDELRQQARREAYSLEDVFLQLTGGNEERAAGGLPARYAVIRLLLRQRLQLGHEPRYARPAACARG